MRNILLTLLTIMFILTGIQVLGEHNDHKKASYVITFVLVFVMLLVTDYLL